MRLSILLPALFSASVISAPSAQRKCDGDNSCSTDGTVIGRACTGENMAGNCTDLLLFQPNTCQKSKSNDFPLDKSLLSINITSQVPCAFFQLEACIKPANGPAALLVQGATEVAEIDPVMQNAIQAYICGDDALSFFTKARDLPPGVVHLEGGSSDVAKRDDIDCDDMWRDCMAPCKGVNCSKRCQQKVCKWADRTCHIRYKCPAASAGAEVAARTDNDNDIIPHDGRAATLYKSTGESIAIPGNMLCTDLSSLYGDWEGHVDHKIEARGFSCVFYSNQHCQNPLGAYDPSMKFKSVLCKPPKIARDDTDITEHDGRGATLYKATGESIAIPGNNWCTDLNSLFGDWEGHVDHKTVEPGFRCVFFSNERCRNPLKPSDPSNAFKSVHCKPQKATRDDAVAATGIGATLYKSNGETVAIPGNSRCTTLSNDWKGHVDHKTVENGYRCVFFSTEICRFPLTHSDPPNSFKSVQCKLHLARRDDGSAITLYKANGESIGVPGNNVCTTISDLPGNWAGNIDHKDFECGYKCSLFALPQCQHSLQRIKPPNNIGSIYCQPSKGCEGDLKAASASPSTDTDVTLASRDAPIPLLDPKDSAAVIVLSRKDNGPAVGVPQPGGPTQCINLVDLPGNWEGQVSDAGPGFAHICFYAAERNCKGEQVSGFREFKSFNCIAYAEASVVCSNSPGGLVERQDQEHDGRGATLYDDKGNEVGIPGNATCTDLASFDPSWEGRVSFWSATYGHTCFFLGEKGCDFKSSLDMSKGDIEKTKSVICRIHGH